MSRQSAAAPQNLSLTEELERLEQSITLTLQEIDHNFSKAHRIVTNSILPIVEQYSEHSKAVWEGSKFWKQFFEASANVSLSGYEENPAEETFSIDDQTQTTRDEDAYGTPSTRAEDTTISTQDARQHNAQGDDATNPSVLDSPSMMDDQSTPRMPTSARVGKPSGTQFADNRPSPYKAIRPEVRSNKVRQQTKPSQPITPGKQNLVDPALTPRSSPFAATTIRQVAPLLTQHRGIGNQDPLLHRVLDKNYRVMTTPHTQRMQKGPIAPPPAANSLGNRPRWKDTIGSSPISSPEVAAPQLRSDIFFSPAKAARLPGVSVLTPRRTIKGKIDGRTHVENSKSGADMTGSRSAAIWDSDSEEDDLDGMSPPKTMQFHIPQSRVLQTPAREASKKIVEDLLLTAGGEITDDLDAEDSPSVIRRNQDSDDSF